MKRFTILQAAAELGVSTATVRRMVIDKSLKATQHDSPHGKRYEIAAEDLEKVEIAWLPPKPEVVDVVSPSFPEDPEEDQEGLDYSESASERFPGSEVAILASVMGSAIESARLALESSARADSRLEAYRERAEEAERLARTAQQQAEETQKELVVTQARLATLLSRRPAWKCRLSKWLGLEEVG